MSLKFDDLVDLVSTEIHIDEYASKMGNDEDVIVISFKVDYKDPAWELSNFIEKGYDWVLDSDLSSGEMEDGSYLVFVEVERRPSFVYNLMRLLKDMQGLTAHKPSDYKFAYRKDKALNDMTVEQIKAVVPMTPRDYKNKYGQDTDADETAAMTTEESRQLRSLQSAAGITPKALPIADMELKNFVNLSKR